MDGDLDVVSTYRPLSVLPAIKIFERLAFIRLFMLLKGIISYIPDRRSDEKSLHMYICLEIR